MKLPGLILFLCAALTVEASTVYLPIGMWQSVSNPTPPPPTQITNQARMYFPFSSTSNSQLTLIAVTNGTRPYQEVLGAFMVLTNTGVAAGGYAFSNLVQVGSTVYSGSEANTLVWTNNGGHPFVGWGLNPYITTDCHLTGYIVAPDYNQNGHFYNVGFWGIPDSVWFQMLRAPEGNYFGLSVQSSDAAVGVTHDYFYVYTPGLFKFDLSTSFSTGRAYLRIYNPTNNVLLASAVAIMSTNTADYFYRFDLDQIEADVSPGTSTKYAGLVISTNLSASTPLIQ